MGVPLLWQVLRQHSLVVDLAGLNEVVDIAEHVEGKVSCGIVLIITDHHR
jgi:hypothetical protein